MKKITALLGLVGVVSMISACSDTVTGVDQEVNEQAQAVSSSSSAAGTKPTSSSQKTSSTVVKDEITSASSAGSAEVVHDTVKTPVYVTVSGSSPTPYYSSGNFCWSGSCEGVSATSTASSSSYSLEVTISSEAPVYPTVTETQMIDQRDQQTYKLQTIAGVHWMAENLKYTTSDGSFCSTEGGEDMCAKYGRYYSSAASKRACPTGWRLPTLSEVQAADAAVEQSWWQIGGRFKIDDGSNKATEFGLADEQGYIWIEADGQYNSFRIKNYSDSDVHEPQASEAGRAYNVRCVENK